MEIDTVNIMVVNKISDECLKQIASVSPRIKILPAFRIWEAPDSTHTENTDCNDEEFNKMLAQAEIIFGFRTPKNVVARAPRLKWVQTFIAGIDHFLDKEMIDSDVIITNNSGMHNIS